MDMTAKAAAQAVPVVLMVIDYYVGRRKVSSGKLLRPVSNGSGSWSDTVRTV